MQKKTPKIVVIIETSLSRTYQKRHKNIILNFTSQHKSVICTISTQKQILEVKIYLTTLI